MAKNTLSNTSSKPQSAMAALLAKHKSNFVVLVKGETVKGKITKLTKAEILVDLGAKTEALILEKDRRILATILSSFKVGDTVEVNVLNPESETGQPIVSLRRYLGNIAWNKLEELVKSKELIDVTITDVTKAGYVVVADFGVSGFIPQSHMSSSDLSVGVRIKASVLELNRTDNKVIFSQKPTVSEEEFAKAMKTYKVGQKVEVVISNVTNFGIFVLLNNFEGFIHISEASWDKIADLSRFAQGDKIEAVITRFDKESKRINLSIKRLTGDPFEALMAKFPVDKKVTGTVLKVDDSGVEVSLGEDIEGLIRKEKVPPMTTYSTGQEITVTVSDYDKRRHKIILVPVLLEKPIGYR